MVARKPKKWRDLPHLYPTPITDVTGRFVVAYRYEDAALEDGDGKHVIEWPVLSMADARRNA